MPTSPEDTVLLKLVMKGVEPGEAARLAGRTAHELEAELNASLGRQVEAHRHAAEAQGSAAQKAAKDEVRQHLDKTKEIVGAIQVMEREAAKAARGISTNWRRVAEDLENLTVVATGAWGIISGGAGRLKALGDSVAQVTNIYGSLKGSIDTMREASKGQIADIDLITTKNRAAQKELELTDEQFGLVAASADTFADALGTSTKDALDGLIDGLATGRTRSLAMAGVVIDESQAFEAYAKKVGRATDTLSDHDKLVAKVEASLRAMDKKLAESAGGVENFGDKWDEMNATISNLGDEMKLGVGSAVVWLVKLFDDFTNGLLKANLELGVFFAKAADVADMAVHPFKHKADHNGDVGLAQTLLDAHLKNVADAQGGTSEAAAKQIAAAKDRQRRDTNPQMADLAMFGGQGLPYDAGSAVGGDTTQGKGKAAKSTQVELTGLQRLFADAIHEHPFDQEAEDLATELHDAMAAKIEEVFGEKSLLTPEQQAKVLSKPWEKLPDKTMGVDFLKAMGWDTTAPDDTEEKIQAETDKILAAFDAARERIKTANKESIGFLSFVFGDDFLEKTREEMSEAEKEMADSAKNMSDVLKFAGQAMAGALGHSIAAAIGENKNFKSVLKDTTHAALMSISERAFIESIWESAMALKDLASYNFPGAAGHFGASAAFAAVGVAAGLGARATYTAPSASASSTPTASRAPATNSSASTKESSREGGSNTFVIQTMFGSKEEAMRGLDGAVRDYRQRTGRELGAP